LKYCILGDDSKKQEFRKKTLQKAPFLSLEEMEFYFLQAIGQPSGLMDIRAGRLSEEIIAKWKELSRKFRVVI
jgi:hypothetical protein